MDQPTENWITEFGINLDFLLERVIKTKPEIRIVTEKDLDKSDVWKNAAVYLVLMRDIFLGDKDYMAFLTAVFSEINSGKDTYSESSKKIYRIDLSEISETAGPAFIQHLQSYDFFKPSENIQEKVPLLPGMKEYWPKFLDLITDLRIALRQYFSDGTVKDEGKAIIYLATTAPDQEQNRDIIRRELLVYGYRVYPDIDLNFPPGELRSYVQKYVDKASLSIHLLGDHYGLNYPGTETDINELQLKYITDYINAIDSDPSLSAKSLLHRLIWMPPEMKPADERQEQLVSQLRLDIEKISRTEIIQAPLELFKTLILRKLRESAKKTTVVEEIHKEKTKLVYLIHDKRDEKGIQSIDQAMTSGGFQTARISYDNGSPNLINVHKNLLMQCDAALVYHHSGSRTWLMSKLSDLMKAPGLGRKSPMLAKGVLITGDDPAENISFPRDTIIMRGKDPLDQLNLFIEKLK